VVPPRFAAIYSALMPDGDPVTR